MHSDISRRGLLASGGALAAASLLPVRAAHAAPDEDGGAGGRDVDLELSSVPGQHWHLNAFVLLAAGG